MLRFRTTDPSEDPDKYALKEFMCPSCGMTHAYHWDSPRYCDNQKCGVLLPEVNSLISLCATRVAWHFRRY